MAKIILNDDNQPEIVGEIEFTIEPLYYDANNYRALRRISFILDVEAPQHLKADYSKIYEQYGEKLKQDFIKFAKTIKPS